MTTFVYVDQENGSVFNPAPSKLRGRLQSAPGSTADKCFKTPVSVKPKLTLGTVNKIRFTPSVSGKKKLTPSVKPAKPKEKPQSNEQEYPDIEKLLTYDPRDFETLEAPEEVRLSHICLAGLASVPLPPIVDAEFDIIEPSVDVLSKDIMQNVSADLESFLQTLNELTVDLPPEPED